MMKMILRSIAAACLLAVTTTAALAEGDLSMDELRQLYGGDTAYEMEMSIQAGPRTLDIKAKGYFNPDGTVVANNNQGTSAVGKWEIKDDGKSCLQWNNGLWNNSTGGCKSMTKISDNKYRRGEETITFYPGSGDKFGLQEKK